MSYLTDDKAHAMPTAKLFWSGRSQAVRLPKDFRMEGDAVRVRCHGASVILEPIPSDWRWLDELSGELDADFRAAVGEQPAPQEREDFDRLLR